MNATDYRLRELAEAAKVRPSHVFHVLHAIAEHPDTFNAASFATFANLEARHVEAIVAALRSGGLYPERRRRSLPSPSRPEKATRLPPAMQLPDDWLAYAQDKRQWDRATTEDVLADFIEHWSNRQDARAAKIDWTMTWQTWVRRDRRINGTWQPEGSTGWSPEQQRAKIAENEAWLERVGRG